VEMEYYKRSGMFPIMHLIGIKKSLFEQYPWLPATVFKAFCQAKTIAIKEMQEMAAVKVTLPWPEVSVRDATELMGEDFWRYGVAENARDIETLARYSFEQGLATRKLSVEEIFHPSVFEISKV
jgi:4,5-dihydroxyphthalate decarboxylase